MPVRKKNVKKKQDSGLSRGILFWTAFSVVVALLFIINMPRISRTWNNVFGSRSKIQTESTNEAGKTQAQTEIANPQEGEGSVRVETQPNNNEGAGVLQPRISGDRSSSATSAENATVPLNEASPLAGNPPAMPAGGNAKQPPALEQAVRERTIYFVKVDSAGFVYPELVKRQVTANDSPLVTTLNILLLGPNLEEKRKGFITLVPEGTRVLNAAVERGIARINFNENFMFNSFGVEGYIAQLKQIIWTATEFVNISEVQITIDGKKVEYLGETIPIDRPLSRDSF